jgi:thiamine biosynthesis lipoprotein
MAEVTLARFSGRAMGSALRLTVCPDARPAAAEAAAAAAWDEVVDEFERSEQAMSRFREASELTELNRAAGTGHEVVIGRRLERAIVAADRARRVTDGRFDPRVLVDLDRLGYRGASMPATATGSGDAPDHPTAAPRASRVACRVSAGRYRLDHPVDLGGIGKGLTLRWAAAQLDRRGVRSYLLEAGGDLVARGPGPGGAEWQVGIEDPAGTGLPPLAVLSVRDLAVATSSVGVHAWVVDGRPVHHLLDPATGQPGGDGLHAVTVAAQDPAWAEVWSKSLFLAGRPRVADVARSHGLTAWWIGTDRSLEMTPAARERTVWLAAEA